MNIKVVESIQYIDKHSWDSLVSNDNVQICYNYMKTIEKSNISDYKHYYFLVYENKELIAIMPSFITREFYLDTPLTGSIKDKCESIRKIFPKFLKQQVLFCGCCITEYNTFNIKENSNYQLVVDLLLKKIQEFSNFKNTSLIVFKDFINIKTDIQSVLEKHKYFSTYSLPSTYVNVEWESFEIYLQSLKKKYRQNIRNKQKHCDKIGEIEFEVLTDYRDISNQLLQLYENTYLKAQVKFEKLEIDFFENMDIYMKQKTNVIIAKKSNKIVGFMLLVNSKESCINVRMGLDYECAHENHLYYMLLYKNIEYAIQNNMKRLYLSQTTYRPKLELGAQLVSLIGFVKHKNPILNKIFKYLFKRLFKKYELLSISKNPHEELKILFPNSFNNSSGNKKKSA